MIRSYFKLALRHLQRDKGYAAIHLIGLAVGMASVLLIALYVRHELRHDDYHEKGDRIYRVLTRFKMGDQMRHGPQTSGVLASALAQTYPDVEAATSIYPRGPSEVVVRNQRYDGIDGLYADSGLFQVFSFDLMAGDPASALSEPNSVVLTQSLARRIFGDQNPVGQTVTIEVGRDEREATITGVARDVPANSHFTFDLLVSHVTLESVRIATGWRAFQHRTYFVLAEGRSPVAFTRKLPAFAREKLGSEHVDPMDFAYELQPLSEIYFGDVRAPKQGDVRYVYALSAVAIILLLIACGNYINLAMARALGRGREVGVRKALGARRTQLAAQFLGESLLLSLCALPLALGLLALVLPAFNALAGASVTLSAASTPWVWLGLVGMAVGVGLGAGSYPALVLARFQPVAVLRGRLGTGRSPARLRTSLTVVQFALAATLIFSVAIVLRQLHYIQHKDLGFDEERIVMVPLDDRALRQQAAAMQEEFARLPGVAHVTTSGGALMDGFANYGSPLRRDGSQDPPIMAQHATVAANFVDALNIRLVTGRDFSAARPADRSRRVILNETAVRRLGWTRPEAAVGASLSGNRTVIGVVEDFHFRSLHQQIEPVTLSLGEGGTIVARLRAGRVEETLGALRETWDRFAPDAPFAFSFLDATIDRLYRQEQRTAQLFSVAAGLAIFLACLGLFGLVAYLVEQRTKEVGIRKTLGASAASIIALFSKDVLRLVVIAMALGAPVAYVAMQRWLVDFAYRVALSPELFVGAGLLVLLIALLTAGGQALRAALMDPVAALRSE